MSQPLRYVIIVGRGRSGTSWIGAIMNTHYHCIYKYEPFFKRPYDEWFRLLDTTDAKKIRKHFDRLFVKCRYDVDMPPFLPKSFRPQNPVVLRALYAAGKQSAWARKLYEWYGRPGLAGLDEKVSVLIKQVNFPHDKLPSLCSIFQPALIGVVRNPFANIASYLVARDKGLFLGVGGDVGRRRARKKKTSPEGYRSYMESVARKKIENSGKDEFFKYYDSLKNMPTESIEALLWRMAVEPMVEFIEGHENGMLVVYEDMCSRPLETAKKLFDFAGWEMTGFTKDYLSQTVKEKQVHWSALKAYYSIYKDPEKSMNKWKTQLTNQQKKDIALIIKDSPLVRFWPDLPLDK